MMRVGIKYEADPEVQARSMRKIIKQANFDVVADWHKTFVPEHFEHGAEKKYGYRPREQGRRRDGSLRRRKRPYLVKTGELARDVQRSIRISGSSKRARGTMQGARKANYAARYGSPTPHEEITAVVQREADVLAWVHARSVEQQINETKQPKTV